MSIMLARDLSGGSLDQSKLLPQEQEIPNVVQS
jgi:hypothetical protein